MHKTNVINYLKKLLQRTLISIILFLSMGIMINNNDNIKLWAKENVFTNNLNFSYFTNIYNKYFGKITNINNVEEMVFNDNIIYKEIEEYDQGFKLIVNSNYTVPIIESGIIVYIGQKDNYGNTIIIQGIDGVDIWYGNINIGSYSLYDYVEKGNLLGEVQSDFLYLVFNKEGNNLSYEEYLN